MQNITEVRTDHCDDQNIVHVDVYFTDDENEGGLTIGYIDLDSRKIIPHDVLLMNEPIVQEAIAQVLAENWTESLLIELPSDYIKFNTEREWQLYKQGRNIFGWPDKYPCYAVYVKTELNPNGKDEEIYDFLYPKTYPQ